MEDRQIREAFKEMKRGLSPGGKCPEEAALARFVEGTMEEKESEEIATHLITCTRCGDYVVSLNRVIHFSEKEYLPEVPKDQIKQACQACGLAEESKGSSRTLSSKGILEQVTEFIKECFTLDWVVRPIPVAVKSCALALLLLLIVAYAFFYYQGVGIPPGVQIEVIGKTDMMTTRGIPAERIIREGDTLYTNDYCRINFELERDGYAYVLLYDSSGTLHQLYPDSAHATPKRLKGNTYYTVPAGENNWFQLDDTTGTETFMVLASPKPISGLKETLKTIQGLSIEEVLKTLQPKAAVLKTLNFQHQ